MRWIALALVLASTPVEAHCFARWYYPWPQHCGVARNFGQKRDFVRNEAPFASEAKPLSAAEKTPEIFPKFGKHPTIALPSLAQADLDGGAADELTRARLELLGYAHAH